MKNFIKNVWELYKFDLKPDRLRKRISDSFLNFLEHFMLLIGYSALFVGYTFLLMVLPLRIILSPLYIYLFDKEGLELARKHKLIK